MTDIAALMQDAREHHRRGALAEAAERYQQVLRADPSNGDALYYLAQASCQQGRLDEGIEQARRALAIDPGRARGHLLIGMALGRLGRPQEALASLDHAIACQGDLADAHGNRGDTLVELGRHAEAVASYDRALAISPDSVENWCNRGAALMDLGRHEDALASYDRAVVLRPDFAEVHFNRGNALAYLGRHREALAAYDAAVALIPNFPDALNNRANTLRKLDRPQDALAGFDQALALAPDHFGALVSRGDLLRTLGRHEDALASYSKALAVNPNQIDALMGQGSGLIELSRREDALRTFERVLALDPRHVDALNNRGFVLNALGRREEALESYDQALKVDPGHVEALNNRGVVLSDLGLHEQAITSYDRVLAASPDHLGALCNRAKALNEALRYGEALSSLDRALAIDPDHAEALFTRGNTLVKLNRDDEAIACYEKALAVAPDHPHAAAALANRYLWVCDWDKAARSLGELKARIDDGKSIIAPLTLFGLPVSPADLLKCTKRFVEHEIPHVSPSPRGRTTSRSGKIRLAYVSGDFRRHPVSYLIAELFERHDRTRFEVIGVSLAPDDRSDIRVRIVRGFDRFHDASTIGDRELVKLLRDLEVDIAVDLSGYTDMSRPAIFAYRPAPIQVNYLGYAGTMGADFIDYVIADRIVLPFDQQPYYAEKIVHLPDSYLVNDTTKSISSQAPSRAQAGLPERGFVFCCFNNSYKISASVFDAWMRILAAGDGSVLWLSQPAGRAAVNLRAAATARGIDPRRLIFAPRVPQMADHLARHRLADLFLDTLPYNAHTTASDALWAGLPVVTCLGDTFAGRVAASLLNAIGLPELVTSSLGEYEALARKLAADPALLQTIRRKLEQNRQHAPLFDTDRFRRHIEAAYTTMWQTWQRGEEPRGFSVDPMAT